MPPLWELLVFSKGRGPPIRPRLAAGGRTAGLHRMTTTSTITTTLNYNLSRDLRQLALDSTTGVFALTSMSGSGILPVGLATSGLSQYRYEDGSAAMQSFLQRSETLERNELGPQHLTSSPP